jgi:hypothetical protein
MLTEHPANKTVGRLLPHFSISELQMAERVANNYLATYRKTLSRSERSAITGFSEFLFKEVAERAFGPPIEPQKQPTTMQQLWQKARGQLNRAKLWTDRKVEDLEARPFGNYDDPKEIAVRRVIRVMRRLGFGE